MDEEKEKSEMTFFELFKGIEGKIMEHGASAENFGGNQAEKKMKRSSDASQTQHLPKKQKIGMNTYISCSSTARRTRRASGPRGSGD